MPKTADRLAPDWGHWLNMASVTVDEAIYLSLNVDPRIKSVRDFASKKGLTRTDELKLQERLAPYTDRLNQVGSALVARNLISLIQNSPLPLDRSQTPIQLQTFIKWVASLPIDWKLPTDLESLMEVRPPARDNPKEISSYQKILMALVKKHYKYDPADEKSPVTSQIRGRLEDIGQSMDDETIRKCLRNSARYFKVGSLPQKSNK
jgi:hypothetical protein